MRVIDWLREGQRRLGLRLEESHHPYNILSTNRAFAKHFTAIRARCHVTAFKQNAFNGCVHANFTQINRGQFIDGCNDKPRKRIRKLSIGKCVMWDIIPGQFWRSSHSRWTRSSNSLFSQHPLKSTRFSMSTSLSCFTVNSSNSALKRNRGNKMWNWELTF